MNRNGRSALKTAERDLFNSTIAGERETCEVFMLMLKYKIIIFTTMSFFFNGCSYFQIPCSKSHIPVAEPAFVPSSVTSILAS